MPEIRFIVSNDQPVPLPPDDTSPIDGVEVLSLDAACERFQWPRPALESLYETAWAKDINAGEPPVATAKDISDILYGWQADPVRTMLRRADFGWVKDADFAVFLAKCSRRRIDPWCGEAFPRFEWNQQRKQNELILITTIGVLRARAHATGDYAGFGKIQYEYADSLIPVSCYVPIYKLVQGQKCEFIGEALWSNYYPGAESGTLWDEKPEVCLGICAERAGLHRAFPQLAGLYTAVEFSKPRERPRGSGAITDNNSVAHAEPEPPDNQMGFHLALIDLGLATPAKRDDVIAFFRSKHPRLIEDDAQRFYGIVLAAVRRNPKEWGAVSG